MSEAFALTYIPRRMKELRYGDNYYLKFRRFILKPLEQLTLTAYSQLFLLLDEPQEVTINSDFGNYDLLESNSNEIIEEHQGLIVIKNNSTDLVRIRFIQVIPKHRNPWRSIEK